MVRSHVISIMCISMFTSTMLCGITDFIKDHKASVAAASAATLAAGMYCGACKNIRYAMDKRILLLKSYYYKQAQQPITRAQSLTAVALGVAGFGVYKTVDILVQKLKGAHE